jgi:hypothetical protein
MEIKQTTVVMVLVALALTLTIIQTASAASVFVHNETIPPGGAVVTYTVDDHTARYIYTFHRTVTVDRPDIELPLPQQFQVYDMVSVKMDVSQPFEISQDTDAAVLGDYGIDAWFDFAPS